mmetsp:Transcript_44542/g.112691  ORF Transcript_44542/g.112691 Transcript_44542/m.112691 type:complete len:278 (+) Transcript_44542:275-1108(+)
MKKGVVATCRQAPAPAVPLRGEPTGLLGWLPERRPSSGSARARPPASIASTAALTVACRASRPCFPRHTTNTTLPLPKPPRPAAAESASSMSQRCTLSAAAPTEKGGTFTSYTSAPACICRVSRKWPFRKAFLYSCSALACAHTRPVCHSTSTMALCTAVLCAGSRPPSPAAARWSPLPRCSPCSASYTCSARSQLPPFSYAPINALYVTLSGWQPSAFICSNSSLAFCAWHPCAQAEMSELYVTTLGAQPSARMSASMRSASCQLPAFSQAEMSEE